MGVTIYINGRGGGGGVQHTLAGDRKTRKPGTKIILDFLTRKSELELGLQAGYFVMPRCVSINQSIQSIQSIQ